MSYSHNSHDSDSDTDSIATTTLQGLLDIDDFFYEQPKQLSTWQTFVRMNQDIFYEWVEFLPPQLVAIRGITFITKAMRFRLGPSIVKRRTVNGFMLHLYPGEIPGRSEHFHVVKNHRFDRRLFYRDPALKKLVTRVPGKDVHDVWYEMNLAERRSVNNFLQSIGVTWVSEHLV